MTVEGLPAAPGFPAAGFRHSALIVESDRSLRELLVPAVRRALTEADGVSLAVSDATARLLRAELGPDAGAVRWEDRARCQRLGFAYEAFRRFLAGARDAGRRVHVFAEPSVGGPGDEPSPADRTAAFLAYEAFCNETYAGCGCPVTCLWDARRHSAPLIDSVRALHSHELGPGGDRPNAGYVSPRDYLARRGSRPLPAPAGVDWAARLASTDDLPGLRARLRYWTTEHRFAPVAAGDVLLAVNEIATNGLTHGRPPVTVRAWHAGDTLVVQVDDRGGIPLPPAGGYEVPDEEQDRTRGLWLARQLADVMQTHTADGSTTAVRLHFPYQLTHVRPPHLDGAGG
jgi:anti-sigma regulatory factor (Ser/Thr protein kinase)